MEVVGKTGGENLGDKVLITLSRNNLILITFFVLFVAIGISGHHVNEYITSDLALKATIKWSIIPIIVFSIYYAYTGTFGDDKRSALWKKSLGFILLTIVIAMVMTVSTQGWLIWVNSLFGVQRDCTLEGRIVELKFPKEKKIGNKYSINISRSLEKDTIWLDVPTNDYSKGENFTKRMKKGCLGFVYSKH